MHADRLYLRERMRSLSPEDLRRIIQNERGDYTPTAVQAAQDELRERPSAAFDAISDEQSASETAVQSLRSRLPRGLWYVFCVASGTAVLASVAACVALTLVLARAATLSNVFPALSSTVAAAAVAFWLAAAIRAERPYVRVLVLSLLVAAAIYHAASVVVHWPPAQEDINALGLIAVAFWYFRFSKSVSHYYHRLQASSGH